MTTWHASTSDRRSERLFGTAVRLASVLVVAVMAALVLVIVVEAIPALSTEGFSGLLSTTWDPSSQRFGVLPLIYGTVVVSVIAMVLAVPLSLGIALYTTQMADSRTAAVIGAVVDVLAALPSVVFGLWGFYQLVPAIAPVLGGVSRWTEHVPILCDVLGESGGTGFPAAGMVLALMITPIITSVSREVLQTVPDNDRMGALALGATRWEMIHGVVLHHSRTGLVGAVMLGLGRAMGETVAVALLIGASPFLSANLLGRGEAMTSQIFRSLSESGGTLRSVLFVLAGLLMIGTILVNLIARRTITSSATARGAR